MIIDEAKRLISQQEEDARRRSPEELGRLKACRAGMALEDLQWHCLVVLIHDVADGESIMTRLNADPWEHPDPRVVEMWKLMTAPANEGVLKRRFDKRHDFNSVAKRLVEEAWRQLQERKQGGMT